MRYIVCYDISDNKNRLKVAKMLKGFGVRTQKSVFEMECDEYTAKVILIAAEAIIDPIDKFFLYPVDKHNEKNIIRLGAVGDSD
ncbi:CRISPR-associated endonuclease Cas2, partial [Persephonella sp.]